jgi:hypothetical protein
LESTRDIVEQTTTAAAASVPPHDDHTAHGSNHKEDDSKELSKYSGAAHSHDSNNTPAHKIEHAAAGANQEAESEVLWTRPTAEPITTEDLSSDSDSEHSKNSDDDTDPGAILASLEKLERSTFSPNLYLCFYRCSSSAFTSALNYVLNPAHASSLTPAFTSTITPVLTASLTSVAPVIGRIWAGR